MRFLLMLGTSSIAMNRVVIEQLQGKLSQAAKEELSETARNELMGIIKLLKEQESAFSEQERLAAQITETKRTIVSHEQALADIHAVDEKQNAKDNEHDAMFVANEVRDTKQDEEIHRQQAVDKAHDKLLKRAHILAWVGVGIGVAALIVAILALAL